MCSLRRNIVKEVKEQVENNNELKKLLKEILEKKPDIYQTLEKNTRYLNGEMKKYYFLGMIAGMEMQSESGVPIEDIKKAVRSIPTKATDKIVDYLYCHAECYHGELARAIGISDSGLSTIIKKIEQCPISLIETLREGKYKVYNLTKEGRQYVESKGKTMEKLFLKGNINTDNVLTAEDAADEIEQEYNKIKTEKWGK